MPCNSVDLDLKLIWLLFYWRNSIVQVNINHLCIFHLLYKVTYLVWVVSHFRLYVRCVLQDKQLRLSMDVEIVDFCIGEHFFPSLHLSLSKDHCLPWLSMSVFLSKRNIISSKIKIYIPLQSSFIVDPTSIINHPQKYDF